MFLQESRIKVGAFIVTICFSVLNSFGASDKRISNVSPIDFGFQNARNGKERYEVLYKAHSYAVEHGVSVDYGGIKRIELEVPKNAKSLPLSKVTDCKGIVFHVKNNQKDFFLFEKRNVVTPIAVKAKEVDSRKYTSPKLNKGSYLLCVEDGNPWVETRQGFDYGVIRKDIIYIENGVGGNAPCATYTTPSSAPVYYYCKISKDTICFSNITLERDSHSTKKTKLVHVSYQNNVILENIKVVTPDSPMHGDEAISIYDCTNIILRDIIIDGTYSQDDKFGYGIGMNNVWNVKCENIVAYAKWGVWCCNNAHKIELRDCKLNRFDIHCYGRDVACYKCTFSGMGGLYSSVFGDIKYEECLFNDAIPYSNRQDFNAYVDFNLYIKNCTFNPVGKEMRIVNIRMMDNTINSREELKEKRLPNIVLKNIIVNAPQGFDKLILLGTEKEISYKKPVGNISFVNIDGLEVNYLNGAKPITFKLSSFPIYFKEKFDCRINGLVLIKERTGHNVADGIDTNGMFIPNLNSYVAEVYDIESSNINVSIMDMKHLFVNFKNCTIGINSNLLYSSNGKRTYIGCKLYLPNKVGECFIDGFARYVDCKFVPTKRNQSIVVQEKNKLIMKGCKLSKGLTAGRNIPKADIRVDN